MSDDKETIKRAAAKARPAVIPDGCTFFLDYLADDKMPSPDTIETNLWMGKPQLFHVDRFFDPGKLKPVPPQEWAFPYARKKAMKEGIWYNGDGPLFVKNSHAGGRPSKKKIIQKACRALSDEGAITANTPRKVIIGGVRSRVQSMLGLKENEVSGLGDDTIRRAIAPLLREI